MINLVWSMPSALIGLPILLLLGVVIRVRTRHSGDRFRPWATGVRLGVLALLVIAFAGPSVVRSSTGTDVIYLLDVSQGMGTSGLAEGVGAIEEHRERLGPADRAGVIGFANEAEIVVGLLDSWPKEGLGVDLSQQSGARLGHALTLAEGMMGRDRASKLVLVTDGRLTVPAHVSLEAIPIDVITVQPDTSSVVLASVMTDKKAVHPGETVTGHIAFSSAQEAMRGTLSVALGDDVLWSQATTLEAMNDGTQSFSFALSAEIAEGSHGLTATWKGDESGVSTVHSRVEVRQPSRIWVIAEEEAEVQHLVEVLRADGLPVESLNPQEANERAEAINAVGLFILGGMDLRSGRTEAQPLSEATVSAIAQQVGRGAGMITLGGPKSYDLGAWGLTELAELLPVELAKDAAELDAAVTLILVLDKSGSMNNDAGGRTRMAWANDAVVASMRLLRPLDRVGVLAVDDTLEWAVPVRPLGTEVPARAVRQIRASGGGILVYTSLDAARSAFQAHRTPLQHVILFADAQDAEEKVQGHLFGWGAGATSFDLVGAMASEGVTVSVVAVGSPRDQDTEFLRLLAEIGKGRFYLTRDAGDLKALFVKETTRLMPKRLLERPFFPQQMTAPAFMDGIALKEAPALRGMVELRARRVSKVHWSGPGRRPLLATWRYGLGRVASLATDAGPRWAGNWLDWKGYDRFWVQISRWAWSRQATSDAMLDVTHNPQGMHLRVVESRPDSSTGMKGPLGVKFLDQQGKVQRFQHLRQVQREVWETQVQGSAQGVVVVEDLRTGRVLVRQQLPFRRASEQDDRWDWGERSREVSARLGGVLLGTEQTPAVARPGRPTPRPLWHMVLLAALLLLPVDAWARKNLRWRG